MKNILVFDFGASSARAMLVSFNGGTYSEREICRFPNEPVTVDGTLYWDIDALFAQTETALKKALSETEKIDAVSVDTWGVDFAIVDDSGEFIERPVHYRDSRTQAVIKEVNELCGGEEALFERTGIQPQWFNTIYQLYALKKARPESLAHGHFLMMPDLFCHFLTGEFHNEYSEATTTSLIDPAAKSWDKELLDKLGIPAGIFCDIRKTGDIYGYVKPELAGDRRIPVVTVPSHDTAAAVAAIPVKAGDSSPAFISLGTWALLGTELDKPMTGTAAFRGKFSNEGGHSGTTVLLKNIMGTWLFQECRKSISALDSKIGFPEMERLAERAIPLRYFIDPNDARFSQPGKMPGKIRSFLVDTAQLGSLEDLGIAQMLRAVYDSLAAEFACALDDLEKVTGQEFRELWLLGGGTKDKLLCRLTAAYSGRVIKLGAAEATAVGNALCAAVGAGEWDSVEKARENLSAVSTFEEKYNDSAKELYRKRIHGWR